MNEDENGWRFVKKRTAADGAVYVSADKMRYWRTGGAELQAEAAFQRWIGARRGEEAGVMRAQPVRPSSRRASAGRFR